jgi:Rrf2 family cysteine metabolism transcriptional repressor
VFVSQKCQYALRALFELAKQQGKGPVKIADIAEAQAIPIRFLEVILSELKQGRFVESRRGKTGGYLLAVAPDRVAVGDVVRFVEGPLGPVGCIEREDAPEGVCPLHGNCVFLSMWTRVQNAVSEVYDHTTLQDLVDEEKLMWSRYVPNYTI